MREFIVSERITLDGFITGPNGEMDHKRGSGKKYSLRWTGYKVHLTETCEPDQPHLIIHVATTPAADSDVEMTEAIQADLQQAQMLPSQHLLDTGYVNADVLVSRRASLWD